MPPGRRLPALLVALALVAVPPVVLRALCVGESCDSAPSGPAHVPFCTLPARVKALIAAGYRSGRSPDVLGVTATADLQGGTDPASEGALWPAVSPAPDTRVPIVLFGDGVAPGAHLPDGMGLDRIAPSLADVLALTRAHPQVRAGTAIPGISAGTQPALVVEIVWRDVGSTDLESNERRWPFVRNLMRASSAATLDGDAGSLPLDPAATLTTIGTGGTPAQHGITGTFVRNTEGVVTRAWDARAPTSVISTLADDLDAPTPFGPFDQAPRIGLVATDPSDRGLIGGNWYQGHDDDDVTIAPDGPLRAVRGALAHGYGADATPDLLGVVLSGSVATMDARTKAIVATIRSTGRSTAFVVTATGTTAPTAAAGASIARQVDASVGTDLPLVQAAVPGGLFLNQAVLESSGLSSSAAVDAMAQMQTPDGEKLFADAFPGFAVSFARYC
ncbi:MAG TPA: hypothetical protein VH989_00355 [Actinomycetota bacterium]